MLVLKLARAPDPILGKSSVQFVCRSTPVLAYLAMEAVMFVGGESAFSGWRYRMSIALTGECETVAVCAQEIV